MIGKGGDIFGFAFKREAPFASNSYRYSAASNDIRPRLRPQQRHLNSSEQEAKFSAETTGRVAFRFFSLSPEHLSVTLFKSIFKRIIVSYIYTCPPNNEDRIHSSDPRLLINSLELLMKRRRDRFCCLLRQSLLNFACKLSPDIMRIRHKPFLLGACIDTVGNC